MRIANNVEMLELAMSHMGGPSAIHPTLIWDNETVILVDTGFPGQLAAIRAAMDKAGIPFTKLTKVIITHQDIDHIGGLPGILNELPQLEVIAHAEDKPYIQGEKLSIKATPERRAQIESLPEERRNIMKAIFENPPKAKVNTTVADGKKLPYCGGITVIHTPGHTPGHICLYLHQSKTLITGDALNLVDGRLVGPNPQHTYAMDQAVVSLKKLAAYDIEMVICYHGGLLQGNANQQIAALLK